MIPRGTELHHLSLDEPYLIERGTTTAVCSCGAENTVTGKNRTEQWAAAYDWHADHRLAVNP